MRFEPFNDKPKEEEKDDLNINEKIEQLYHNISDIGASRGHPPPTTIVMGMLTFKDWYNYCEKNDLNYMKWQDKQVMIDKQSPLKLLAVSYHPNQQILEEAEDKLQ